ncbi:MAG: hypothetical protein ACM3MG_00040, partial [Bacillota bacterium]
PAEFNLNTEQQRESSGFKFGARMTQADLEESSVGVENSSFPDVDLKDLERELLGGGAPDVEKIDVSANVVTPLEATPNPARAEIEKAKSGLAERMKKYSEMVADVKVSPKSTVTRVEARRRQKELSEAWDSENISKLDKLRREFTKALFKK